MNPLTGTISCAQPIRTVRAQCYWLCVNWAKRFLSRVIMPRAIATTMGTSTIFIKHISCASQMPQVGPSGKTNALSRVVNRCAARSMNVESSRHRRHVNASGAPSSNVSSLASARVDPFNQPENGLTSRDAEWSVSLLSLPGRAGLDLGLSLSYSSMIWTHSGPYIYFDEDNGWPGPGFRLGFPTVQQKSFDAQAGRNVIYWFRR